ncbi:MAG: AI-2E family transporter [Planctomycetota bacterium]|nr:AI-2E family transporter [Planctomycetota bacterium]
MSRYVSFGVLLVVILLLCIIFYKVMAAFLLPLFLATVLVVIFRPLHDRVLEKCKGRKALASAVTTAIICLSVIVPVGVVGLIGFGEARQMFRSLTAGGIEQNVKRIRSSLDLVIPASMELQNLEEQVNALDFRNLDEIELAGQRLDRVLSAADKFELAMEFPRQALDASMSGGSEEASDANLARWRNFRQSLLNGKECQVQYSLSRHVAPPVGDDVPVETVPGPAGEEDVVLSRAQSPQQLAGDYRQALTDIPLHFDRFKMQLLGGRLRAYLKELANPTEAEFERYNETLIQWIQTNFLSLSGRTSQFVFTLIFNGVIMMIAVYFFLLDGSKMVDTFKFLSPLDDRHEQELISEFGKVSRAVVLATLAAAVAQGVLAGIGYYFAGAEAVVLLTLLTTVLALVPFIGAGSVWIPTCLYLYLVEDRLGPAVLLAIWGAAVVSTVDNLIKPLILHGQSNIHPLFALLSVLGGVSALGPIGILVGPMVVAFLQTLLTILQRELRDLDTQSVASGEGGAGGERSRGSERGPGPLVRPEKDAVEEGEAEDSADCQSSASPEGPGASDSMTDRGAVDGK